MHIGEGSGEFGGNRCAGGWEEGILNACWLLEDLAVDVICPVGGEGGD